MSPTKKRYNTRFSVRNDEIVATSDISASLFGDIPKVRSLSKRIANSKQKSGVLADATNAKSIYTTSLRPRVKPAASSATPINCKKRQFSSECDIGEDNSSSSTSTVSSSYSSSIVDFQEQVVAQSPESPTKKRSTNSDIDVSENTFLTPRCLDFSLFMCCDGNGDILREIMSYFFSSFDATGNEAKDLLRDGFCTYDIKASFLTCKSFADGIDKTISSLLLPSMNVTFNNLTSVPGFSLPATPYLNTFQFLTLPERRVRSHTAMDTKGKQSLDKLYTNPVFCVRFKGIRQGKKLYPALGSAGTYWPLQLHTFFKMRTYTKFDRLMNVYAQRSYLPLPWLDFQITDRFYDRKEKKPILTKGDTIMPTHNLWTIGMEPTLEGSEADEPLIDEDPDIWVDSYVNCAEDECFVCVRDCRSKANIAPLRISWPARCEEGAQEGALLGDGSEVGAEGKCGRFVSGDSSMNSTSTLSLEEPGQPVRPQHPGWMFKVKQSAPLQPIMDRVELEIKHTLFRSENMDANTPVTFRCIATTSFGNEKYSEVDGRDSPTQATAKTLWGDATDAPFHGLPIHVLELRDLAPVNIIENILEDPESDPESEVESD